MSSPIWTEERVARWLAKVGALEAQLEVVSDVLFAAAALRPGERVLDVGCGTGSTTRRAHDLVGPTGAVTGIDLVAPMIDEARRLSAARPSADQIDWVVDDVVGHRFPPAGFDVVLSRFGVMFFSDPRAAFTGLAEATRPGGRLCLAVWLSPGRTPMFDIPLALITDAFDAAGIDYDLETSTTGASSLGDADRVRELLGSAGWQDLAFDEHLDPVYLLGPGAYERGIDEALDYGSVRLLLEGRSADEFAVARAAVAEGLRSYYDGVGIRMPSGFQIVSGVRA